MINSLVCVFGGGEIFGMHACMGELIVVVAKSWEFEREREREREKERERERECMQRTLFVSK